MLDYTNGKSLDQDLENYTKQTNISIKLDDINHALWSQVVEMYISSNDKLGYINVEISQSLLIDPTYQ